MDNKRNVFYFILAILIACALPACRSRNFNYVDDGTMDLPEEDCSPVTVPDNEGMFIGEIVPVAHDPDETVESLYYRIMVEDDEVWYEVQVKNESAPMRIAVSDAVIFSIKDDNCYMELVTITRTGRDGAKYEVPQYHIFARWELDHGVPV